MFWKSLTFLFFPAPMCDPLGSSSLSTCQAQNYFLEVAWSTFTLMTSPVDYWLSQDASGGLGSWKTQEESGAGPFTAPPAAWSLGRYNCNVNGILISQKLLQRKSTINHSSFHYTSFMKLETTSFPRFSPWNNHKRYNLNPGQGNLKADRPGTWPRYIALKLPYLSHA